VFTIRGSAPETARRLAARDAARARSHAGLRTGFKSSVSGRGVWSERERRLARRGRLVGLFKSRSAVPRSPRARSHRTTVACRRAMRACSGSPQVLAGVARSARTPDRRANPGAPNAARLFETSSKNRFSTGPRASAPRQARSRTACNAPIPNSKSVRRRRTNRASRTVATSSGMLSASRILTRALPAGLLAVLAAPAAALAAPVTSRRDRSSGRVAEGRRHDEQPGHHAHDPGAAHAAHGSRPSILVMMTGFTRILIVLSFVRKRARHAADAAQPGARRLRALSSRCS